MYAQNVWLFDLARRHQAIRLLNTRFHEANPAFSPDGKWLAFTSDESGRPELYLLGFRSGDSHLWSANVCLFRAPVLKPWR